MLAVFDTSFVPRQSFKLNSQHGPDVFPKNQKTLFFFSKIVCNSKLGGGIWSPVLCCFSLVVAMVVVFFSV